MHARHRSPGNGYRSSSMGMGSVAATPQISPEGSIRGHGMYNSEYRNYNRGFGRGHPKPFQPPQPPPRKGDIFMEAGRLATEYLVSKGLLPPNALSGKWQNGSLKNYIGDFQGFRMQEGENLHLPPEGRTSALARLGNVVPNVGPGRRRFSDEYSSTGSRNYMRGKRRTGSFKNYGSDWSQEIGRSGSWSDRARFSPDMEGDDLYSGDQEEQQVGKDIGSGVQKSHSSELAPKSNVACDSDSESEKYQFPDDMGSKASSSSTGKDLPSETDLEVTKASDDLKISNVGNVELKDGTSNDETEKESAREDVPIQHCGVDGDLGSKNGSDLLSLCKFAKVPTKTRSSLTVKGSKVDPVIIIEDEKNHDIQLPIRSGVSIVDVSVDGSSCVAQSNEIRSPKKLDPDVLTVPSLTSTEAGELSSAYAVEQGKCTRSRSFPEISFMNEQELGEGPPGFGKSGSMVMERGEKRAGQLSDSREGTKKLREWVPSKVSEADEHSHFPILREKQLITQEGRTSPGEEVILAADHERSSDISLFPEGGAQPCIEYAEEKQFFPGSFKICDLNLMEASDVNENHDILFIPSIPESKNEAASVDIDLSISNNCNMSDKYGRRGSDSKAVEVIDLENDSVQEDKAFSNSDRKAETVFTGLESFPHRVQNTTDIPDVQDGYGLMISDYLGTDISNCSSVRADINSLHNEIGLHNAEGIFGDVESMYMSLGEIPISFLPAWEHPTQEHGKPF